MNPSPSLRGATPDVQRREPAAQRSRTCSRTTPTVRRRRSGPSAVATGVRKRGISQRGEWRRVAAAGTPVGTYTLRYGICEILAPSNCAEATSHVDGPVAADHGRKLLRERVVKDCEYRARQRAHERPAGNAPATLANVTLRAVSLTPASNMVRLDLDGSVDVLRKDEREAPSRSCTDLRVGRADQLRAGNGVDQFERRRRRTMTSV